MSMGPHRAVDAGLDRSRRRDHYVGTAVAALLAMASLNETTKALAAK